MSPQPKGGGDIVFGVIFKVTATFCNVICVGVCVRVASFPHVIFLTDGRILTKLAQIYCWEGGTS